MTTYLLDTHVVLWMLTEPVRLSPRVRPMIEDAATRLAVSSASAWEIATKQRLGKLPQADGLVAGYERHLRRAAVDTVDVSTAHALLGGGLDWDHRDPFDRTIAATALVEGYPLITADPVFETLNGLTVMW